MTAKELMIGDWVKLKPIFAERNGLYQKIAAINSKENTISFINKDGKIYEVGLCCIDPIPLTKETFAENGFNFAYDAWSGFYFGIPNFKIPNSFNMEIGSKNFILKYVHELQHALRLCGLTELADNFKV